jgi:CRISPR/Cas system-associated exonuclease Cas4 (RecB family)
MSEASVMEAPAFDPASDLARAYQRYMQSLVKKNGPSANTRASSIGNDCERALFYERTVPAEERVAHQPELQAIFELGKDMERIVVRRLEDMGCEIVQRGRDYVDRAHQISGHTDVRVRMPGWPRAVSCEVKGLGLVGERIKTLDDMRHHQAAHIRRYVDQALTYLFLADEEIHLFVLFSKASGWPTIIAVPRDDARIAELLAKADRVQLAVLNDEPPSRTQSKDCGRCQFATVCLPDVSFGPGVQVVDDAELLVMLERREELAEAAKEFKALDEELKDALPRAEEVLLGDYVITSKEVQRRGYEVKPGSYWRRSIRRIGQ